ncbi:MAG TPA: phosphatidylserine decarboxylase [Candidatus Binataceae bacterium]
MALDSYSGRRGPGALAWRIAAMLRIAPEGAAISLATAVLGVTLLIVGLQWLGLAVIAAAIIVGTFFRDPDRYPQRIDRVVVSGADGKVVEIAEAALPCSPAESCRRVSVFMSPLNVHVNRAPVGGEVARVAHTPGDFHAAYGDRASEHNERNLLVFTDAAGRRHAMVQIAGYLARRIVCRLHARDKIQTGQRIGLIMFGSRVDHYVPAEYRVTVAVGERVRAGETVIGELDQ